MIPVAQLRVEVHMTNPPTPKTLAVVADGKILAVLTIEEVKRAVAQYDAMAAIHAASRQS